MLWQRARLKNLKSLKPFREVRSSVSPQENGMVEMVNGFGKLKKEKNELKTTLHTNKRIH